VQHEHFRGPAVQSRRTIRAREAAAGPSRAEDEAGANRGDYATQPKSVPEEPASILPDASVDPAPEPLAEFAFAESLAQRLALQIAIAQFNPHLLLQHLQRPQTASDQLLVANVESQEAGRDKRPQQSQPDAEAAPVVADRLGIADEQEADDDQEEVEGGQSLRSVVLKPAPGVVEFGSLRTVPSDIAAPLAGVHCARRAIM